MEEDEVGRACCKHEGAAKCQESFGVKDRGGNLRKPWRRFEETVIKHHKEIGYYRLKSPVPKQRPVAGLLWECYWTFECNKGRRISDFLNKGSAPGSLVYLFASIFAVMTLLYHAAWIIFEKENSFQNWNQLSPSNRKKSTEYFNGLVREQKKVSKNRKEEIK
jgi:hypothetical protein